MDVARRKLGPASHLEAQAQRRVDVAKSILGMQDLVAIDVGAANGLLPHWEALDGVANIYQVEPRAQACRELNEANERRRDPSLYKVIQTALSEKGGPSTLYVTNAPTGSSLLPIDVEASRDCSEYVDRTYLYPIVEETINTETLATVMGGLGRSRSDMIKLDAQGTELQILHGFGQTNCQNLLGIEIEIGLHEFYPPECGLEAILPFMRSCGLELFDARAARVHRPFSNDHSYYQRKVFSVHENSPSISARIWEFDAVFFRRKSLLIDSGDADALRRMALVYCVYNYFSEAYDLLEKAEVIGLFTNSDAEHLKRQVIELHRLKCYHAFLADTPGMERWRRMLYRIAPRSAPRWCQYMYQNYPNG
jgi:FkbM family methyltransferase